MFDIESMPDLLKPCGIVYSKNCFDPLNRPDDNYQLIQDILVSKSSDIFSKSDILPYNHEGLFEANTSVIPVENVTPVTPPFSIEAVSNDQFYPYTNLQKVSVPRQPSPVSADCFTTNSVMTGPCQSSPCQPPHCHTATCHLSHQSHKLSELEIQQLLLNLSPVQPSSCSIFHGDPRLQQGRNLEELTRLLMPIIDEAVKRSIDKIASKISEKLNYKLNENTSSRNCTDFNSNEVDVENKFSSDSDMHTDERRDSLEESSGSVSSSYNPKAKRCKNGTDNLKEELSRTLGSWKIDMSDKTNFSFGLWQSKECGTNLQDYYLDSKTSQTSSGVRWSMLKTSSHICGKDCKTSHLGNLKPRKKLKSRP